MTSDVEALRKVRFFEELTDDDLSRVAKVGQRRSFAAGDANPPAASAAKSAAASPRAGHLRKRADATRAFPLVTRAFSPRAGFFALFERCTHPSRLLPSDACDEGPLVVTQFLRWSWSNPSE